MSFPKSIALISLIFLVACSSQSNKPLSRESQEKVDRAEVKSKLELVIELGAVIQESDLNSRDKALLMEKFESFVKDMAMRLAEQNKVVSALINNLSSTSAEGMKIKNDLERRFEQIEKENSKKRMNMMTEITNTLQGKVSADKIEKINQVLSQKGFLIIQATEFEEKPKSKKHK